MAKILDGKVVRDQIAANLKTEIEKRAEEPTLAILQVGSLPESSAYIRQKQIFAEKIGAQVKHFQLDENVSEKEILKLINGLNSDEKVNGIIVQLPIPAHL